MLINTSGELPAVIPGVQKIERLNTMIRLEPQPGIKPQDILNTLVSQGIQLNAFEIAVPSLDEIFIKVVKPGGVGHEQNL